MDEEGLPQGRLKRLMGDAFLKELKELLAGGFTGNGHAPCPRGRRENVRNQSAGAGRGRIRSS